MVRPAHQEVLLGGWQVAVFEVDAGAGAFGVSRTSMVLALGVAGLSRRNPSAG